MKTMRGRILKNLRFIPSISSLRQGLVSHLNTPEKCSHLNSQNAPPHVEHQKGDPPPEALVGEISLSEHSTDVEDEELDVGPHVLRDYDIPTSIEPHEKVPSMDNSEPPISPETIMEETGKGDDDDPSLSDFEAKCPPGGSECIILYTTSLRSIRKTFEDCQTIRFLLGSFKVMLYERDVSMHLEFREELWRILGGRVIPPRLFIKGRYIGGADEVVCLHERGKLKKLLEGIPRNLSISQPCAGCGNMRFVVCLNCNGSRKVLTEEENEEMCIRCPECNENGLVKCPICSCESQ